MVRLLLTCTVVALIACEAAARGEQPWESAAFTAKPADVLRAAAAMTPPKDADVDLLLVETRYTFDGLGRRQCSTRQVMRFLTPKGVTDWSSLEGLWAPWCEDRPQLRARVLAPDGAVRELDPRTIGEAPVEQEPSIWSDRKILRAPLPAVRPGCIAETEVVLRETQPYFAQGAVKHILLAYFHPMRQWRLVIDYPDQLPLRYEVRGSDLKPTQSRHDGQSRLVFQAQDVKPLKLQDLELYSPPEVPLFPEVTFSTGRSWKEIAGGYEALVEKQMDVDAVQALAREAVGAETGREQAAARLLTRVQQLVRYTGLEFGSATIVPQSPRDTLARRYGDCKDQATLLVAMLRSAGLPAHVALIHAGRRTDVAENLPGLDDFNHAIVCVPGNPPLWLDPTDKYAPAGQLPLSDQGRLALLATRLADTLTKTPVADYRQNYDGKAVEYTLADSGACRVRETHEARGSCGERLRSFVASQNEEDLRKVWEAYFCREYRAKALLSFEHGAPQDLSKPFRIITEAADAKVSVAGDDSQSVQLLPYGILARLPYPALPVDSTAAGASSLPGEAAKKDRKSPLCLPEPHVCDLIVQVAPPPGFVPGPLPSGQSKQFGPLSISTRFEVKDEKVTASFRLDTGAGTLTAAEVNDLRRFLREIGPRGDVTRWAVPIEFEYLGAKEFREGRWKEALHVYLRTASRNPTLPGPRWHYVNALLKAGFGDAARLLARQTVDMEPKSAWSYVQLARVLSHDLLGRYLRNGMDRPAALAAYRKALELDPSDAAAHTAYAILLEHDDDGSRYSSYADLDGAIKEYREARRLAGTLGRCDVNLATDLFFAGEYAEVDKLAGETPAVTWRGLLIANEAAWHGIEGVQRKLQQIADSAEERRALLLYASDELNSRRLYPQSVAVLRLAMTTEADQPALEKLARSLAKMRRIEEAQYSAGDPRSAVQQALAAALAGGRQEESLLGLYTATSTTDDKNASTRSLRALLRNLTAAGRKNKFPPQRLADSALLFDAFVDSGDDDGRRITISYSNGPSLKPAWYVVREPKGYRILAADLSDAALGAEALRQLDAKHAEIAARWLNWAAQDKPTANAFNSFSATPFAHLWRPGNAAQADAIRPAAAALAAEGADPAPFVPILLAQRQNALVSAERLQLDRALATAYYRLHRWKELLEIVDRFREERRSLASYAFHRMAALDGLNRRDELRHFLAEMMHNPAVKSADEEILARWGCALGEFAGTQQVLRDRASRGEISPASLNELACDAALQEPPAADAIDDALAADSRTDRKPSLTPGTLALIYAEQGRISEAHDNLLRSLEDRVDPPGEAEWYTLGRIAEACGFNDIAALLYRKISAPKLSSEHSIYSLAQRRLKKHGPPAAAAPKGAEPQDPKAR